MPLDPGEVPEPIPVDVELDPDPPLDPAIAELRRMLGEQATAIGALRAELASAQGGQLATLLDSHERTEAARQRALVEATHAAKERAEWGAWVRTQLTRLFAGASIAAAYVWGRPDTHELIDQLTRVLTGGDR